MNKLGTTILSAAIATALAAAASAQTDRPRDASRPPAEAATTPPPGSPRDQQNRKDIEKDRSDSDLAIERKCGELPEDARERCMNDARAQRDRGLPPSGTAATPAPPSASSPTPGAPPSGSSTGASPSGGATGGSAAPAAGGVRR